VARWKYSPTPSLDHRVGASKSGLSGSAIGQSSRGPLNGNVGWAGALDNPVNLSGNGTGHCQQISAEAYQAPGHGSLL
jgi:hypothetical protein